MFLDCRTLEYQHAPLPENTSVVILDTSTRRGLVDSAYNERRSQCEEAARWFGVKALRDVSVDDLKKGESGLSEVVMKRARHIVTENARVLEAVQVMKAGNVKRLGELFNASHNSLRDDFEVTNEALNQIVECAQEQSSLLRRAHDRRGLWRLCRGAGSGGKCPRVHQMLFPPHTSKGQVWMRVFTSARQAQGQAWSICKFAQNHL